ERGEPVELHPRSRIIDYRPGAPVDPESRSS
ncbi:MAG: hypothetical protein QOH15_3219, partial [Gaiellales bacterium]|nr:hypothetical protein [Gaiellales bacterium]